MNHTDEAAIGDAAGAQSTVASYVPELVAAGVADKLWSMDDLVALVDAHDAAQPRKRPGRKRKACP